MSEHPCCNECGMPCFTGEYHPYAACLMFKACANSETVRANLSAIHAPVQASEARGDGAELLMAAWLERAANSPHWRDIHDDDKARLRQCAAAIRKLSAHTQAGPVG